MTEIARLYGVTAKGLKEGQLLQVSLTSIEGRTVAILDDQISMKVKN